MQRVPVNALPEDMQELVDMAARGDEVIIVLDDEREIRLVPEQRKKFVRRAGTARGLIIIHEDFDDPLPNFDEYM